MIQNPPNYETVQDNASATNIIPISANNFGPFAGTSWKPDAAAMLPYATWTQISERRTTISGISRSSISSRSNFMIGVDYNGSRGVHLYDIELLNRPGYGNIFLGDPLSEGLTYLNDQYTGINRRGDKGWSNYQGTTVRAIGRNFGNIGLTLNANYTWSHSEDNLSSTFSDSNYTSANNGQFITGYLDPYAPMLDKGSSDFDLRQRVALSAVWEIPAFKNGRGFAHQVLGGWSLDPIFTAETGQPFSIFDCGNAAYVCPRAEFADTDCSIRAQQPSRCSRRGKHVQLH